MPPSPSSSWRRLSPRRPRSPSSYTSCSSSGEFPSPTHSSLVKVVLKVPVKDAKKRSKAMKVAAALKMVLKVPVKDAQKRSKAMKVAAAVSGCISVELEGDHMVVVGDGMDPVNLVYRLRKWVGHTEFLSVGYVPDP